MIRISWLRRRSYQLLLRLFSCKTRVDVIFDGQCRLCRRTARTLRMLDLAHRLRFVDLRHWHRVETRHPGLDFEACQRDMHAVLPNGRSYPAVAGYLCMSWRLPPLWPMAVALQLPPLRRLADRAYRRVADRRRREGCGDESCPVHRPPRD